MPKTSPASSSSTRPARLSLRLAFALQALAVLAFIIFANLLASRHNQVRDLSANRDLSLAPQSLNVLNSVDRQLRIVLLMRRNDPLYDRVYKLVAAADREINELIDIDTIDPIREPNRANKLLESIRAKRAANAQKAASEADNPEAAAAAKLPRYTIQGDKVLVMAGDSLAEVDVRQMVLEKTQLDGSVVRQFRGEQLLISAILRVTQAEPNLVGLVTDVGRPANSDLAIQRLAQALPYQNSALVPLELEQLETIPAGVSTLLFLGPQTDLSAKGEQLVLNYWQNQQGGLTMLLEPGSLEKIPRLLKLPRYLGISPQAGVVLKAQNTLEGPQINYSMSTSLAVITPWNPAWERLQQESVGAPSPELIRRATQLTQNANWQSVLLPPQSLSLRVDEADLRRRQGRARITPILAAPEGYWLESNAQESPPKFDPAKDMSTPLPLAALVDLDPSAQSRGQQAARLAVVGNSQLISEQELSQSNFDFVLNLLNWTMAKEELIGIRPKSPETFNFELDADQNRKVQLVYLGLIPSILLSYALFIFWLRRK